MTPVNAAPFELAELAVKMRPAWDRRAVDGAIQAARTAGWSWARTFRLVTLIMADEEGEPRDILAAVRNPLERQEPAHLSDEERAELLAEPRSALAEAAAAFRARSDAARQDGAA